MVQYDIKHKVKLSDGRCKTFSVLKVFYEEGVFVSLEFKMQKLKELCECIDFKKTQFSTLSDILYHLKNQVPFSDEYINDFFSYDFYPVKNKRFGSKKGEKFENSDFMKIAFWEKCYAYYIKKAGGDEQEQKYEWKGMEKSRFIKEFGSQKAIQNFYRCDQWFATTKDISTFLSSKEKVKQWVLLGSKKGVVKHPDRWDVKYMESLQDVNMVMSYKKHLKKLGYISKRTPTRTVYVKQKQTI
jgi:hypothetical protein